MTAGMTATVTFFRDFAATTRSERTLALPVLAKLIRTTSADSKERLPWLKLARFGNARSKHDSLRHDRNVIAITGIEGDYDAEKLGFDYAIDVAEKAEVAVLIYTSPSHSSDRPRWRVLCPLCKQHPPADRNRLMARLNGLYRWRLRARIMDPVASLLLRQRQPLAGTPRRAC